VSAFFFQLNNSSTKKSSMQKLPMFGTGKDRGGAWGLAVLIFDGTDQDNLQL
jgi:hypothetical protein